MEQYAAQNQAFLTQEWVSRAEQVQEPKKKEVRTEVPFHTLTCSFLDPPPPASELVEGSNG